MFSTKRNKIITKKRIIPLTSFVAPVIDLRYTIITISPPTNTKARKYPFQALRLPRKIQEDRHRIKNLKVNFIEKSLKISKIENRHLTKRAQIIKSIILQDENLQCSYTKDLKYKKDNTSDINKNINSLSFYF